MLYKFVAEEFGKIENSAEAQKPTLLSQLEANAFTYIVRHSLRNTMGQYNNNRKTESDKREIPCKSYANYIKPLKYTTVIASDFTAINSSKAEFMVYHR